jgi:hypothetical protein
VQRAVRCAHRRVEVCTFAHGTKQVQCNAAWGCGQRERMFGMVSATSCRRTHTRALTMRLHTHTYTHNIWTASDNRTQAYTTHTHTHTHAHAHPPRGKVFQGGGGTENESLAAYASISSTGPRPLRLHPPQAPSPYTGLDHLSARNLKPHHENCKLSMKNCVATRLSGGSSEFESAGASPPGAFICIRVRSTSRASEV